MIETAAQRYRRIKEERHAADELHDVTCPSGMVFKCRTVSIDFLVSGGILPLSLVQKMSEAEGKGDVSPEQVFLQLPLKEKLQSIDAAAKLLRYVCVEPRIVDDATGPNDIRQDEVEPDDFNHIVEWATKGGVEAARLATFRVK